jgi:mannosyltransferase
LNRDEFLPAADATPRQSAAILAALLVVGVVLRTVAIGRQPLWADEALTAVLVHYPWWSFALTPVDPTSPLFYWLEQALVPEAAGPAGWRMVSLIAGVATIALAYWLGRGLHSRTAGLVSAGLVAVSAPLIDYSQEARAYALVVAMIAGSAAALASLTRGRLAGDAPRSERRRMLAVFASFTALATLTHFIAIFWVFPALFLLRLAADGERRRVEPREMIATIVAVLPFVAIELRRQLLVRSEQNGFSWLTQISPARGLQILGEQWLPFAKVGGLAATLIGLAALLALLWFARRPLAQWMRSSRLQGLIVLILLLGPLGLWLMGELLAPVAMPRTFLPASLGFAALAGIAIASLRGPANMLVGTAVVALSLASTLVVGTVRHKEQWAQAARVTRGAAVVINCPDWKTPSFLAQAKGVGWVSTSHGDHALVVRQPGDRANWAPLYFDRIQRLAHYPLRRDQPLRLEPRPLRANRLMFVASDCSKTERDAFAAWAGLQQSKLLWSAPRTEDAADIRVEEWRLSGAEPLDLWIVR